MKPTKDFQADFQALCQTRRGGGFSVLGMLFSISLLWVVGITGFAAYTAFAYGARLSSPLHAALALTSSPHTLHAAAKTPAPAMPAIPAIDAPVCFTKPEARAE